MTLKISRYIRQFPVFWINQDSSVERKLKMMRLLSGLGVEHTRVAGTTCADPIEGCARSHLRILEEQEPPFIILEDDCGLEPGVLDREMEDRREEMDALYLGISQWAMLGDNYRQARLSGPTLCEPTPWRAVMRIRRMLSAHAVLYFSRAYVDAVAREIARHLELQWHCDVACAEVQEDFRVYALNPPLFFQDEPKNRDITRFQVFFDR